MSNDSDALREWFRIVTEVLKREDLFLRNALQPHSTGAYEDRHPGIALLREQWIGYLLLRELWSVSYPRAFGWELSYPYCPRLKLDLAIYHQSPEERIHDRSPECPIEVKIKWFGRNQSDQVLIWWDLLRLLEFDQAYHRYLLLLTIGPNGDLLGRDVDDLISMRLGRNRDHYSRESLIEKVITESVEYIPYYLQHFDGVREILWNEFETHLSYNRIGRVRVSLIEVFRRG